jgi:glycosyltransferase involved in cell wall biosynthesis
MQKQRDRVKVFWVRPEGSRAGNALGYDTHNSFMRKYSSEIMDLDDSGPIALHIVSADHFQPIRGKINVLFTMWEALDVPQSYIDAFNMEGLHAIIVPCRWCKDLFSRYTRKPIYVCNEGIDPDVFKYHERSFPLRPNVSYVPPKPRNILDRITNRHLKWWSKPKRFRFFWSGAPNPRKGYQQILQVINLIEQMPECELYIKTTMPKTKLKETIRNTWRHRKQIFSTEGGRAALWRILQKLPTPDKADKLKVYGKYKNIFFDTRKLPIDQLVSLYNDAHCFLFPTSGEGWGLTLCEALATGCPAISTAVTGVTEFFDEKCGYPIDYDIEATAMRNYDLTARVYVPRAVDMAEKMFYVVSHYREALQKSKYASGRIHRTMTWRHAAERLDDILREVLRNETI